MKTIGFTKKEKKAPNKQKTTTIKETTKTKQNSYRNDEKLRGLSGERVYICV